MAPQLNEWFPEKVVLGIETSCDETSAAVTRGIRVLSNVVASQLVHREYGGVVPELASRAHMRLILTIVERSLQEAEVEVNALEGVAVATTPGLVGSLLVGVAFAKAVAACLELPLVPVNHIEGHIFSCLIHDAGTRPPFVCLVVSGGHTLLLEVRDLGRYEVLGRSLDDAAGEVFDKVGRMLGVPYPAGEGIDRLARSGDPQAVRFPRPVSGKDSYDFSFSGLKTAVRYHLEAFPAATEKGKAGVLASFQNAMADVLTEKTIRGALDRGIKRVAVAGGVAANSVLRRQMRERGGMMGIEVSFPPPELCTDNAGMVAAAGAFHLQRGRRAGFSINASTDWRLGLIEGHDSWECGR